MARYASRTAFEGYLGKLEQQLLCRRHPIGLVSSKRPALECKADLIRRVNEAARLLSLEQLAIRPQCGFAFTIEGNLPFEEEQ
jgi:hypothetical protein